MSIQATPKSPGVEGLITQVTGKNRVESINNGACMTCAAHGLDTDSFRDGPSLREYCISGMCQACQDSVFGEPE